MIYRDFFIEGTRIAKDFDPYVADFDRTLSILTTAPKERSAGEIDVQSLLYFFQ